MKKEKAVKDQSFKQSPDYIPVKEKIAYACGAFMDSGGVALMSCVMLNYMTDSLGILAAAASTIMMIAKIWDAITDPLMGHITDNTRSKWGRRRPYIVLGGISLFFALMLLFAPIKEWGITSQAGMIAYVLTFYIVWNTCSTITQVPYTSMASDISPSFSERNNANTVKLVFSALASGLAYIVPLLLLGAYQKGTMSATVFWIVMFIVFGTFFGGGLVIAGLFSKERVKPDENEPKQKFNLKTFFKGYIQPYKNKSYAWHIAMYVCAFTCMDMLSALATYYASHVWRGSVVDLGFMTMNFSSMFIIAPVMVAAVLAFPLVRVMMDKKGKAFAFRMGLPFYILGGILLAVLDPSWCNPLVIPFVALIMGFGFGGAQMIPWMNFPDTLDVAEFAIGERPTGNYSGMMTLVRKISGAFGVGLIGWILSGVGYDDYNAAVTGYESLVTDETIVPTETVTATTIGDAFRANETAIDTRIHELVGSGKESFDLTNFSVTNVADNVNNVLLTIRVLMGAAIAILIAFALFSSFQFKITNKILTRMRYFSDTIKAGGYDSLTEEEKEERIDLIKKHYGKYDEAKDAELIQKLTAEAKQ